MSRLSACGALMAGGRSIRMGTNKALLDWQGQPLIAHLAGRFAEWFSQVVIVTNSPADYSFLGLPMVSDRQPDLGPLAGLEAALRYSREPVVFCAACDMPFLNGDLIAHMVSLMPGYEAVVPRRDGRYETLHAAYGRACLPHVSACLDEGQYQVRAFFDRVRVRELAAADLAPFGDPGRLLFNCNTPADLEQARRWAARG